VVHRVGAVTDHNTVNTVCDFLADLDGQLLVLLWSMFSLKTANSFSVVRLQMSASSGTAP